ncbi:MAG: poly(R)-hydroxyalkanoic acid synthase subunit PhaE [Steroidobacteraceae bacterium]
MNQAANHSNWIDAWLETQRGWVGRWQSLAGEQRVDAMRESMNILREQLNPAAMSPEALNVVQSFQALLQSCMANAGEMVLMLNAEGEQPLNPWQQMLQVFPLGPAREQLTAWQEYTRAQAEYQLRLQVVLQAYGKVFAQALEAVPNLAEQRAAQGKPINGFRELYELWIECGEQSFAGLAHDENFISAQAACGNALSRLKRCQNVLIEYWLKSHDLPTRSEMNSVHLRLRGLTARVAELEQQLQQQNKPSVRRTGKRSGV